MNEWYPTTERRLFAARETDEQGEQSEVVMWQDICRIDFQDCMYWVNNLRSYMRLRSRNKAQRKAALRRIANLRAALDGLEIAINSEESQ